MCFAAKMAYVDPMVAPGNSNFWHLHTFFGNTDINPNSDLDSLASSGNSTCGGGISNRSSYWVPTVIDSRTGAAIEPDRMLTYYFTQHKSGPFNEIPEGMRMLAGDATSTSPQSSGVYFRCKSSDKALDNTSNVMVDCPAGNQMWQIVAFPSCSDGRLDSANHKDHLRYWDRNGNCPASHPAKLPQLKLHVFYNIPAGTNPRSHWRLSSDAYSENEPGGYSAHGDYVFGWDPAVAREWLRTCINGSQDCGSAQPVGGRR